MALYVVQNALLNLSIDVCKASFKTFSKVVHEENFSIALGSIKFFTQSTILFWKISLINKIIFSINEIMMFFCFFELLKKKTKKKTVGYFTKLIFVL